MRLARTATKIAVFTAVGVTALAACAKSATTSTHQSSKSAFTGIPLPSTKKVSGGTVTFGMAAGATPTYIFEITPGANSSVYAASYFQNLMVRPLWWTPVGHALDVNYPLSLASKPTFSNDNKTVVINMKTNYKWSTGAPVDAQDVVFFVDLVKAAVKLSAANYGNYSPGYFPDNLASIKATGKFQVTLTFTKSYNPGYLYYDQLLLLTPLPSASWDIDQPGGKPVDYSTLAGAEKVYKFLNAQSLKLSTYATNPLWQVVDGPFKLTAFNPSTDANTMVPNPAYSGPDKPSIAKFQEVAFTSDDAEYNALRSGQLTVGLIPSTDYPQIPTLEKSGFHTFGFPDLGWDYLLFNFKDKTDNWDHIIGQLYVRQALAHLNDTEGAVSGIFHGYAAVADGPVPSVPQSPFTPSNATKPVYPYSPSAAKALLTSHGWKPVGGVMTCESPGTSASQCGAGVNKGDKLSFTLVYPNDDLHTKLAQTIQQNWAAIGADVTLKAVSYDSLLNDYLTPRTYQAVLADLDLTRSYDPDPYPFWHQAEITGGQNYSQWDNRTASEYIEQARVVADPDVRLRLYRNFQVVFASELPALLLYYPVYTFGVDLRVRGVQGVPLFEPADRFNGITNWYLVTKRALDQTAQPTIQIGLPTDTTP